MAVLVVLRRAKESEDVMFRNHNLMVGRLGGRRMT